MASIGPWNKNMPSSASLARDGDDLMRSHWSILQSAWEDQHYFTDGSSSSAGRHKLGSARIYSGTSSQVSTMGENGGLMFDTDNSQLVALQVSGVTRMATTASNNVWSGTNTFSAAVTMSSTLEVTDVATLSSNLVMGSPSAFGLIRTKAASGSTLWLEAAADASALTVTPGVTQHVINTDYGATGAARNLVIQHGSVTRVTVTSAGVDVGGAFSVTGAATLSSTLKVGAGINVSGAAPTLAGAGMEIGWDGTNNDILSFNRATAAWLPLTIRTGGVTFGGSGGVTVNNKLTASAGITLADTQTIGTPLITLMKGNGGNNEIYSDTASAIKFFYGANEGGRMVSGIFAWGTTVAVSASAGDMVFANARGPRGSNAAGTATYSLVRLNGSNEVEYGTAGVNARFVAGALYFDVGPVIRSNSLTGTISVNIGRTAAEGYFGIAGGANQIVSGDAAGEASLRGDNALNLSGGSSSGTIGIRIDSAAVKVPNHILAIGTSVVTGAAAGDVVLANAKAIRSVNGAGTGTRIVAYVDSANDTHFGQSDAGGPCAIGLLAVPAGDASALAIRVNIAGTMVTKQLLVGAADSAGAGYRTVRIAN